MAPTPAGTGVGEVEVGSYNHNVRFCVCLVKRSQSLTRLIKIVYLFLKVDFLKVTRLLLIEWTLPKLSLVHALHSLARALHDNRALHF